MSSSYLEAIRELARHRREKRCSLRRRFADLQRGNAKLQNLATGWRKTARSKIKLGRNVDVPTVADAHPPSFAKLLGSVPRRCHAHYNSLGIFGLQRVRSVAAAQDYSRNYSSDQTARNRQLRPALGRSGSRILLCRQPSTVYATSTTKNDSAITRRSQSIPCERHSTFAKTAAIRWVSSPLNSQERPWS